MEKYKIKRFLKQLPKHEREEVIHELPKAIGVTKKHFKYNIYEGSKSKAPNLRIDKLLKIKKYLAKKYPELFGEIIVEDLLN